MRYLVAGGAGFIGSNLCQRLLTYGHEVVCTDNFLTGRSSNLDALVGARGFSLLTHDVVEALPEIPPLDGVFHLASPASPPSYQRFALETLRVNSEGTRRLLELACEHRASFLYASTSEVYGDPLVHPQTEGYRGNVSSIGPRSMYDEAKRYGEAMTMFYVRSYDVDARIVRIFNTYGPNSDPEDGRLVPNFITQALRNEHLTIYGSGSQTRSLCYVDDLVDGLTRTMDEPAARGEVINLGNPEEHSILEYAELIRELSGSRSDLLLECEGVGDDPKRRQPDIEKARRVLGWEPSVSLADGLKRTIDYFAVELGLVAAK